MSRIRCVFSSELLPLTFVQFGIDARANFNKEPGLARWLSVSLSLLWWVLAVKIEGETPPDESDY